MPTYAVQNSDGRIRIRASGPLVCPEDCTLVENPEVLSTRDVYYDFKKAGFSSLTAIQKARRMRTAAGLRSDEAAALDHARAQLREVLAAQPWVRALIEGLVVLPRSDIQAILGENKEG